MEIAIGYLVCKKKSGQVRDGNKYLISGRQSLGQGRGAAASYSVNRPRGPRRQIACSLAGAAGAAKSRDPEHFTSSRSLLTNSPLRFRPLGRIINSERKARWKERGKEGIWDLDLPEM